MASIIIWGPSQQLVIWGVDQESSFEWKVTSNEQFVKMVNARWDVKTVFLCCEMVEKDGYKKGSSYTTATSAQSSAAGTSGVKNAGNQCEAVRETCSSPPDHPPDEYHGPEDIDWDTLVIVNEEEELGDANVPLVNEEAMYELLGFQEADEAAQAEAEATIPLRTAEQEAEMREAEIAVDGHDPCEPLVDWDRDNPDMSVGTVYPCMVDFKMAVKQHAIVEEFELHTEKIDKTRFRGCCCALGCPWKTRAKTQADVSVWVY